MKPPVTTRKLTTLSLLAAIALALYAVESALPPLSRSRASSWGFPI